MRLPQSTIRPLFFKTIHLLTISLAVAVLCMWPVTAGAATAQLACSRTQIEFGGVVVGQTETMLVGLTNTGQTSVTVSGFTVSNSEFATAFATAGLNLPLTLPAGQSVDVNISFTPSGRRWTGGTIKVSSNASNAILGLDVGGTGVNSEPVTASPSTVSFGQVAIGASSTQSIVLTNARPWRATLLAPQVQGSEFSISGGAFPVTLGGGQSVTVNVTFAPTSANTTGGSLFLPDVARVVPLVGTGTASAAQLTVTPATVNFGSVTDGTTGNQSVTLSATGASVTVSAGTSSSSQFVLSGTSFPMTIPAGQSASLKVAFTPQNSGTTSGALSFSSNATSSPTVPMTGVGTAVVGQLAVTPATVNFGSVTDGTTGNQSVTLSATGASVTVSAGTSSSSQFVLSGTSFPMTIPAGQSASLKVAFTPQNSGTTSGALSFSSNATSSPTVPMTGVGTAVVGQLTVTPATVNFGSVADGTTQTQPVSLSATGASVTVSSSASSSSQFVLNGASFPLTIAAGQTVSFNVAFTPQSSGTVSGSLSFASNASSLGTLASLTGVGTTTAYNVNLSWNSMSDITGYNVYRSTVANGKFSKINASVNPNAAYVDSTVISGQTYYYAATSVNSSGQESTLSTPAVQAVVP
jgi:hypothetical protein